MVIIFRLGTCSTLEVSAYATDMRFNYEGKDFRWCFDKLDIINDIQHRSNEAGNSKVILCTHSMGISGGAGR